LGGRYGAAYVARRQESEAGANHPCCDFLSSAGIERPAVDRRAFRARFFVPHGDVIGNSNRQEMVIVLPALCRRGDHKALVSHSFPPLEG